MPTSVQGSGPVSLSSLASVFNMTPPYSMSQLVRGGSFVPDVSSNANVPTVPTRIQFSKFYGTTVISSLLITLSANVTDYNLYNAFVGAYGTPSAAVTVNVVVSTGVVVGATNASNAAFDVGQFPTGSVIGIVNNGVIMGAGGLGGAGATSNIYAPTVGQNGGDAINAAYLNQTVSITNNSNIWGGGGGGTGGVAGADGSSASIWYAKNWRDNTTAANRWQSNNNNTQHVIYLPNGSYEVFPIYSYNNYHYLLEWGIGQTFYRGAFYTSVNAPVMTSYTDYYGTHYVWTDNYLNFYYITTEIDTITVPGGAGGIGGTGAIGRGYNNLTNSFTGLSSLASTNGTTVSTAPDTTNWSGPVTSGNGQPGSNGNNSADWGVNATVGGTGGASVRMLSGNVTNNGSLLGQLVHV